MVDAVSHIELEEAEKSGAGEALAGVNLELVKNVETVVDVKLGTVTITLGELFNLKEHTVLTLDQSLDQPLQLVFDGKVIATGQLVAVEDNFGIKIMQVQNK